jgi:hypothetical protein
MKTDGTCEHCWHATGSFSNSTGTVHDMQCCHCGISGQRRFTFQQPIGHGPHAPRVPVADGDVEIGRKTLP